MSRFIKLSIISWFFDRDTFCFYLSRFTQKCHGDYILTLIDPFDVIVIVNSPLPPYCVIWDDIKDINDIKDLNNQQPIRPKWPKLTKLSKWPYDARDLNDQNCPNDLKDLNDLKDYMA